MKIGICAPSTPFTHDDAKRVAALAAKNHPAADLVFHDQCFATHGHFAGSDEARLNAFCEIANDRDIDAVWFVRGGYGACRIAEHAVNRLDNAAREKMYMGYSDAGNMLAALYRAGIGRPVHGPMPADIRRDGGSQAITHALDWMVDTNSAGAEGSLKSGQKYAAFNLMTLAMIVGTPIMPDLSDHILMVEEVSEYLYAFDRAMFHISSHLADAGLTGIQLGRVSDIPENDRPFGQNAQEIVAQWCAKNEINYLGKADIGHDAANKIVPFGLA